MRKIVVGDVAVCRWIPQFDRRIGLRPRPTNFTPVNSYESQSRARLLAAARRERRSGGGTARHQVRNNKKRAFDWLPWVMARRWSHEAQLKLWKDVASTISPAAWPTPPARISLHERGVAGTWLATFSRASRFCRFAGRRSTPLVSGGHTAHADAESWRMRFGAEEPRISTQSRECTRRVFFFFCFFFCFFWIYRGTQRMVANLSVDCMAGAGRRRPRAGPGKRRAAVRSALGACLTSALRLEITACLRATKNAGSRFRRAPAKQLGNVKDRLRSCSGPANARKRLSAGAAGSEPRAVDYALSPPSRRRSSSEGLCMGQPRSSQRPWLVARQSDEPSGRARGLIDRGFPSRRPRVKTTSPQCTRDISDVGGRPEYCHRPW